MAVSDIPGYLQGFVFSDAPAYYNSTIKRFLDQSPYAGWDNNHLDITVGTPSFVTLNGQRGMVLDNTVQGGFLCPTAWEGACIAVMKPNMTANATIYPVMFGAAASAASNGRINITRASGSDYRHGIAANSAATGATANLTTQAAQVTAMSFSQSTRKAYATKDGTTIVEGSAVADTGSGVFCFTGNTQNADYGFRARFGNLSGTIGDTAVSVNPMEIYELHFFKGNPLLNNQAAVQAVIAELKTKYGL